MRSFLTLLFALSVQCTFSQEFIKAKDPGKLLEQIQTFSKDVNEFSSPFIQTKELALMMEDLKSSGQLYYDDEAGMRWEYTRPNESVLVMADGKTMLKQDGEIRDLAGTNAMMKRVEKMVSSCLDGSILKDGTYRTELFDSPTQIKADLYPQQRRMQEMAKKIEIIFEKKKGVLVYLALTDSEGDRTIVEFTYPVINNNLDAGLFKLQ